MPKSISKKKRLLCALIQEMLGVPQVDSFVDECERCKKAVWRAKSSDPNASAICRRCAAPDLVTGAAQVLPPTKKQIEDIKQARELFGDDDD